MVFDFGSILEGIKTESIWAGVNVNAKGAAGEQAIPTSQSYPFERFISIHRIRLLFE